MNKNYTQDVPWILIAKELSGNITEDELKDFQSWKSEKIEHHKLYDECKLIFEKAQTEDKISLESDAAWLKLSKRIAASKKKRTPILKIWHYATAALIALMLLGSYWVYPQISTYFAAEDRSNWLSVKNTQDEPKTIQMPDRSTIILNKNAEIRYPEKFDNRAVELKGEALFKVAYNPKKAFKIFAAETEIEVLGTTFNVNQKDNEVFVMVEDGKVNFSAKDVKPVSLLAGKGAFYNSLTKKISPKINLNAAAWNTKTFRFQNTPVSDILTSLSDVYGLKVQVSSDALLQCQFNGVFDNIAPENILHAISFSIGAKLTFENNIYTLNGSGCNN